MSVGNGGTITIDQSVNFMKTLMSEITSGASSNDSTPAPTSVNYYDE